MSKEIVFVSAPLPNDDGTFTVQVGTNDAIVAFVCKDKQAADQLAAAVEGCVRVML